MSRNCNLESSFLLDGVSLWSCMYEEEDAFFRYPVEAPGDAGRSLCFCSWAPNQVTEVMAVRLASLHLQSRDRCRWFEKV